LKKKEKSQRWDEVDREKEEAGRRDTLKHIKSSGQLFIRTEEKMMCIADKRSRVTIDEERVLEGG